MKKNRKTNDVKALTNGPGKLARALAITKELNCVGVTSGDGYLIIIEGGEKEKFGVCTSPSNRCEGRSSTKFKVLCEGKPLCF